MPAPHPDDAWVQRVLDVVESIPPGRVMTYGDVAVALDSRAARAVGQVMAYYGESTPWWRVIRSGGHPPKGHEARARKHYEREGIPVVATSTDAGYRVVISQCRFRPWD